MTKFIFDLIITDVFQWTTKDKEDFESNEDLESYFGFKPPFTLEDLDKNPDLLMEFIYDYSIYHNFDIIKEELIGYNFEYMYVVYSVVYTIDNKFYTTEYTHFENGLNIKSEDNPIEVFPIEVTITDYVIKK